MLYYIIIAIIIFNLALSLTLSRLNLKASKQPIPNLLAGIYNPADYRRQQDYLSQKAAFQTIDSLVSTAVLLAMFCLGLFATFDVWASAISQNPIIRALAFFGIIYIIGWIIDIPFGIYSTFVIEQRFGFNKSTPGLYAADLFKNLLLELVLCGALLAAVVWIYTLIPQYFWIAAWSCLAVFQLLLQYFYSDVIVPIFNKQTPLEAGELRDAIESFARKADFKLSNIYVLNESKRTSHANAYFTGFGSRKRIVLYDSLIEKLSTQEIVAVLAHEIGHYKHRHNIKNIITSLIISLGILAAFNAVIANEAIAQAAGCSTPSFHVNLVVFSLLLDPLTTVLGIVGNAFSRRDEWQADEFAKVHGMASHLSSALKSLAKSNLSNLTPHPLYVIFNYSHPTMLQRIEHLTQQ